MKYIVFMTINLVNDKCFVGVHATSSDEFDGYLGSGIKTTEAGTFMNPSTILQCAVKRYGVKNFRRVTLFSYDTPEEAYAKEKEIVTEEFIKQDSNYNTEVGGDRFSEPIYQFNENKECVKKWNSLEELMIFFNCPSFKKALVYGQEMFGYYWSFNPEFKLDAKQEQVKNVYKYSENGKLIKEYRGFDMIENLTKEEVIDAIKYTSPINGYYYSFTLTDEFKPKPRRMLKSEKLYLYDIEGNYLGEFSDRNQLRYFTGFRKVNSLFKENGQYQIRREKYDKIPSAKRVIRVYNKLGEILEEFDRVSDAAKKYDTTVESVNKNLRGVSCTAGGYIFKWIKY